MLNVVLFSDRKDIKKCILYLKERNIPILYMVSNSLKGSDYGVEIRRNILQKKYDNSILISYYYGSLIKKNIFTRFKQAVNFHPAPLPYYKGVKCGVHAIINSENKFGVTCHTITEKFDEGNILGQLEFYMDKDETGYSINIKSKRKLYALFKKYVNTFVLNKKTSMYDKLKEIEYNLAIPSYFSNDDFEKLKCLDGLSINSVKAKKILRALWFPKFKDAYYTSMDGRKIYVTHTDETEK